MKVTKRLKLALNLTKVTSLINIRLSSGKTEPFFQQSKIDHLKIDYLSNQQKRVQDITEITLLTQRSYSN